MTLQTLIAEEQISYTGEQLRPHWAFQTFDLLGDSAVAFFGPCDVQPEHMRDVEDLRAASRIYSENMLHFIIEHFGEGLDLAVWRQRAFMAIIAEALNARLGRPAIRRVGSDLYDGEHKLSVSVAGVSLVSSLIHAGINISSRNTPVSARGLEDYGIPPRDFAERILRAYAEECESALKAQCKVRPIQ